MRQQSTLAGRRHRAARLGRTSLAFACSILAAGPAVAGSLASWATGELNESEYRACLRVTDRDWGEAAVLSCALDHWLADRAAGSCESRPEVEDRTLRKRANLLLPVVRRHLRETMPVSPEEASQALERHRAARAEQPERWRLRHIYIHAGPDQLESVREQLEGLREDVLAGGDFAAHARRVSESVNRFNGGRLGRLQIDQLPDALVSVVRQLDVGDISEPVAHGQGVYLFLREDAPAPASRVELTAERAGEILQRSRVNAALKEILGLERAPAGQGGGQHSGGGGYRAQHSAGSDAASQGENARQAALALTTFARDRKLDADEELAAALEWSAVDACARQQFQDRIAAVVGEPSTEALRTLYDRHAGRFLKPETYHVSAIQFSEANEPVNAEAYARFLAAEKRARADETAFAEVARELSRHTSAEAGGKLGELTLAELAARGFVLSRAMRNMQPGELTGLVNLSSGLWLFRLDWRDAMRPLSFAEARDQLERQWRTRQRDAVYEQVKKSLLEEAGIATNS